MPVSTTLSHRVTTMLCQQALASLSLQVCKAEGLALSGVEGSEPYDPCGPGESRTERDHADQGAGLYPTIAAGLIQSYRNRGG